MPRTVKHMTARPPIAPPTIAARFNGFPPKAGGIGLDVEDANKEFTTLLEPRLDADIDKTLVSVTVAVGLEAGLVDELLSEEKELDSVVVVTTAVFGAGKSLSVRASAPHAMYSND